MIQAPQPATLPTLKKRVEFLAAAKGGRCTRNGFVLQAIDRRGPARIGYTVTKKVGNAVERNRIRRRLRSAVRAAHAEARDNIDYVIIGRRAALRLDFDALVHDLKQCLKRAHTTPADRPHIRSGKRTKSRSAAKNRG